MSSKRTFFLLIGLNCLLVLGIFVAAYQIDQLLGKKSQDLVKKRLEIQTLDAQNDALGKAKKDVAQYKSLADIAKSIVPQDKSQAQTVREIVNIAAANGIKLGSVTFPSSTLGDTISNSKLSLSQLEPVKGIPGVYSLQVIVQSDANNPVPYDKVINFLRALEHNRRTALVSNLSLTPDSKVVSNLSFTLTLDEYLKP
jgi:hypothetical protein